MTEINLAARWLGASVLAASDESFGDKENLLLNGPSTFEPGRFGNRGEIVDGWETRRRRAGTERGDGVGSDLDWAVIRLGTPGVISSVDVDTSDFTGNHPVSCTVEATGAWGYPAVAELVDPTTEWTALVDAAPVRGDAHNVFAVSDQHRYTHVRLSIHPDGGVARFRVFGTVIADPTDFDGLSIDLASVVHGGLAVASSDEFYSSSHVLNRPDRARTMGEGWETRRRRDGGHDFVTFRLAFAGTPRRLIVDTAHFKYNATASIEVFGAAGPALPDGSPPPPPTDPAWTPLMGRTRLQPDTRHTLAIEGGRAVSWVRIDAHPDGGLSRIRIVGDIDADARRQAGRRLLDVLPAPQAEVLRADPTHLGRILGH